MNEHVHTLWSNQLASKQFCWCSTLAGCLIGRNVNTVFVSTRSTVAHLHNISLIKKNESCLATKKKFVADFPVNFWCVYVLCQTSFFRAHKDLGRECWHFSTRDHATPIR